jgi:hypothetical protein
MVLCGICLAEERPETIGLELEIEVLPGSDSNPMADGETPASEMSSYFDPVFENLGHWLSYVFSANRPIETGNSISSEVFMSGERAADLGDSISSDGANSPGGAGPTGKPNKPLIDLDASWPNGKPRIESKTSRRCGSGAERFMDGLPVQRSKAEIDAYFITNVVHTRKVHPKASASSEPQRVEGAEQALSPAFAPKTSAATFAVQTIQEPSSILFCGLATMVAALRRRRQGPR